MNFIWEKITEWLKLNRLVGGIMSNLTGLFDSINGQVSEIAATVGATPQGWNGGVFSMVKNLSETVVVPIAGVILTFVMCVELIQMVVDRNSMHDFETFTCSAGLQNLLLRIDRHKHLEHRHGRF